MNVLIVGAGPTGLTCGLELARRGILCRVADQRTTASGLSRAVGITPRSQFLLSKSGILGDLKSNGVDIENICAFQSTSLGPRLLATMQMPQSEEPNYSLLALPQDRTETIITKKFQSLGGQVDFGYRLTTLQQTTDKVTAGFANGHQAEYDYVIGADGVGSATRQLLRVDFPGYELPGLWSIADIDLKGWSHQKDAIFSLMPQGGAMIVIPIGSHRVRVVSNTADCLKTSPFEFEILTVHRTGSFKIQVRQVSQYRHGRVFLAGDAAHCHSPVGGRGMNLGIADAYVLARSLARSLARGKLDDYQRLRHADGRRTIANSERARRWLTSANPTKRSTLLMMFRLIGYARPVHHWLTSSLLRDPPAGE